MKRILFISPLDRRTVPNTREQNIAEQCRALGHDTVSMTLAQNVSRRPWAVLRDTLSWRTHRSGDGAVVRIDPPFNPCTGLQTDLESARAAAAACSPRPARPSFGRRAARRAVAMLSPLGVLRDLPLVPAFFVHAIGRGRFDLCIAYGPWAACVGWLLRQCGRVDVLVYDDQDYEPAIISNRARQRWAIFLERAMMRRADAVVSVGHRLAALRRAQTGREVEVVPNGVRPAPPGHPGAREAVPDRVVTLVYVGNVVPWSGLDVMLDALPDVIAGGHALRVLIVGGGLPAYVDGLRAQVEASGLQQVVRFVGPVPHDQIGRWLSQSDVGLAHFRPEPYRRYAFPLKVVEYMAAGLAVLGTVDTETEDILQRHGAGIAVPFDSRSIGHAIARLATDTALRGQCRRNALQAAALYLWPALAARELAIADGAQVRRTTEQAA